jgi:short-subunit dehydrogenase
VWLCARRRAKLDEQVAAIAAAGGSGHAIELDVRDADATFSTLKALDEEVGFDLAIANAGVGGSTVMQDVAKISWKDIRTTFDTNLLGAVATIHAVLPGMLRRGRGHLVGVSSIAGHFPLPRGAAYSASKAGLTLYLEAADIELRALGIPVTVVIPGFVRTSMLESLEEPTPFVVELERAIDIIERGITRKARRVQFPFPYTIVAGATNALPRGLRALAIQKTMTSARK